MSKDVINTENTDIGRVILVGAGCGDFDLITLRGKRCLKECDVVVYDSLIDKRLMDFCRKGTEKICVGKRAGKHSSSQEEINSLLVQKAAEGRIVVRLKGGDPFVFGRGGEEIIALKENDIPFSVVPGITSSVAVPELAGIPVTHRDTARSFHVITGHTSEDMLPENMSHYAKCKGTLIFLMGLRKLPEIAAGLTEGGMSADTPAAVISKGGTPQQRVVRSDLGNICSETEKAGIEAPAVIVVGETAAFDFSATFKPPLSGISAAVAAAPETSVKIVSALNTLGSHAFRTGDFHTKELYREDIYKAFANIENYSWIVLSSPKGAEYFLKKLRAKRIDIRRLSNIKFAVIGSGTAAKLEESGIFADLIPEKYTSAALGNAVASAVNADDKVLILRSKEGSPALTEPLKQKGIQFDDIDTYEPVYGGGEDISADYIIFTSAGAARSFFGSGGSISEHTKAVAIGEVTAKQLKQFGIEKCLIPEVSNTEGIVDKILEEVKCEDSDV
ncbi:uroporphyrinogen-III C-methyltransferase [uncultured Ruminococcus sp.]|uniref:uroporphyrinogen-III C-methyltransferase n=1 Tax=uncultured Ruminococcus sp. TaxID=165186 RepID=UPI0025E37177|nr:uroporphyrinogen-III C-methyltransferase [uncultured Ruminococcus sp.]